MTTASVDSIERTVQTTNEWIAELERELGTESRAEAWRALRAYLQVLRDRSESAIARRLAPALHPGEFDDVLAQLPSDIREVLETG